MIVSAQNLNKKYGKKVVLKNVNFSAEQGEIIGVVGTNGAGKTTLLKSLLGLAQCNGNITVCGLNPRAQQAKLMEQVSFIADTATLPKWITSAKLIDYMSTVHPAFDRQKAEEFIANTNITPNLKVEKMSKGMVTQLHLALVTSIKSTLMILDEPTLGLDIIRRKAFYTSLLNDYFDDNNTIIITTHQIEEIEQILTRVVFIDNGQVLLDIAMEDIAKRYVQVTCAPENKPALIALSPLSEVTSIHGIELIFDCENSNIKQTELSEYGVLSAPSLSDLFVALVQPQQGN